MMNKARAYFTCFAAFKTFRTMCAGRHKLKNPVKNCLREGFHEKIDRGSVISKHLLAVTSTTEKVAPYALSLYGRTWYLSKGLDDNLSITWEGGVLEKPLQDIIGQAQLLLCVD